MASEIEFKKKNLERFQKDNLLEPHWLKKDFIFPMQAVLIYYGINPANDSMFGRDEQFIRMVDWRGVYDVLLSSKFLQYNRGDLELAKFVEWLVEKDFPLPVHLQKEKDDNYCDKEAGEEADYDILISSVKLPVLLGEIARRLMVKLAKEAKYKEKPSTEIIEHSDEFKTLRALIKILRDKDFRKEWYQQATKNEGPRARK